MNVYKIRNKKTGKFRTGGYYSRYTGIGKVWCSLTAVKLHLNLRPLNKDDEVVEFNCHESLVPVVIT